MRQFEPVIDVVDVVVLGRYVLELRFEDGAVRVIDLEPLLEGPMYRDLRDDYELVTRVSVDSDAGTITWPNGADISPRRRSPAARQPSAALRHEAGP